MNGLPEESWGHQFVAANGARFHVVESQVKSSAPKRSQATRPPLVLFLHGFPQAWWAWRHQLPAVAAAGYPAAAMDLRGYGASDKPPRGYDPVTLAADVVGVAASLGHRSTVLVGHGWGGYVAWTAAITHRERVAGLVAISAPHPRAMLRIPLGLRRPAIAHVLAMQPPWLPERRITTGRYLERHLRAWSSTSSAFPTQADIDRCQEALGAWPAPHCALEYHRWLVRSRLRSDGRAFAALVRRPVEAPVLLINGSDDPALARPAVDASGRSVRGPVTQRTIEAAGHFPHEEQPSSVTETLLQWLSERAATGVDLTG